MNQPAELALWVEDIIKTFIETSPENTLQNENNDKSFAEPLIGFAKGDDTLFKAYKDHVGPFYMTPWEIFAVTLRDMNIKAENLTVISWVLPHTPSTKDIIDQPFWGKHVFDLGVSPKRIPQKNEYWIVFQLPFTRRLRIQPYVTIPNPHQAK